MSPRKNHKWDKTNDKNGYWECEYCKTTRQKDFPRSLYFVPYQKYPLYESPNCTLVKEKAVS